jgi:hypothetical protein
MHARIDAGFRAIGLTSRPAFQPPVTNATALHGYANGAFQQSASGP